jgi:FAD/FMN-containing dehydrogenase
MFRPVNKDEVAAALRAANEKRTKAGALDLGALDRVLQHTPEDMTVTVEAGITLDKLQAALARRGQWLPMDPPKPESLTIAALLSENASGPRRFGFGTVRDHLIGLHVALADGRLVRSGGKVVKNVAGFDLLKLFIDSHGTLGLVVEATFKLLPRPETEHFAGARCSSAEECRQAIDAVLESELTPVVLDCHRVGPARSGCFVVLGFSGTYEEVDWQLSRAGKLGFGESATLDYDRQFWAETAGPVHHWSVLPSRLTEVIREIGDAPFVARAGNGMLYARGGPVPPKPVNPVALVRRVKDTFDPNHVLADLPE